MTLKIYKFSKEEKLRTKKDFEKVIKYGKKIGDEVIDVFAYRNGTIVSRLGLIISKKLGKACERNKLKRRLREIFRLNNLNFNEGFDIIFKPKPPILDLNYKEIESRIVRILKNAKIFRNN